MGINNRPPQCQARQRGDQISCNRCGFTWDMDDSDPPECTNKNIPKQTHEAAIKEIKNMLKNHI